MSFGSGSGQAPMGGPVYHYDADNPSTTKLPEYWDRKAFFGEFSQDYLAAFTVDWETFDVTHIEDFLPNAALAAAGQPPHDNPMDLEVRSRRLALRARLRRRLLPRQPRRGPVPDRLRRGQQGAPGALHRDAHVVVAGTASR